MTNEVISPEKCGVTHYHGCACHESSRNAQLSGANSKLFQAGLQTGELLKTIAGLKSELAVARERLGPAGYAIIQEVAVLRKERPVLKMILERLAVAMSSYTGAREQRQEIDMLMVELTRVSERIAGWSIS
jgi:hypothetical protein